MKKQIYPAPLYTFLSAIDRFGNKTENLPKLKILDCGAGGETPSLGLFHESGFETFGIDISEKQILLAKSFEEQNNMEFHLTQADMRKIPFENESFDYTFEYNSLGHMSKADTDLAIREMHRVLKKGGLCYLGFMSLDCWPIIGREIAPGEFSLVEGGDEVVHSIYADNEPDQYFSDWIILQKEKNTRWFYNWSTSLSLEEWQKFYDPLHSDLTAEEWENMFAERIGRGNYTHTFYLVKKN